MLVAVLLILGVGGAILAQDDPDRGNLLPEKKPTPNTSTPAAAPTAAPGAVGANPGTVGPTGAPALPGAVDAGADSPYVIGAMVVVLLVGGIGLLIVEIALIPGLGIPGFVGVVLTAGSLMLAFWKLDPRLAVAHTLLSVVVLAGLAYWTFYVFPHTRLGKAFVLETAITDDARSQTVLAACANLVGQEGVSLSDLRPSGIARIGQQRVEVTSEGDFIPRNTRIKVLAVRQGDNVIVVPLGPATPADAGEKTS